MADVVHYALTITEERARRGSYVDPGDYAKRPQMLCLTGDGHAVGTRKWADVTCPHCLARRTKHEVKKILGM